MWFPTQEYWNGLLFPSPGDLLNPGFEPTSLWLRGRFFTTEPPGKPIEHNRWSLNASWVSELKKRMSGLLIKSLWKKEHNHFCLSTLQRVESSWAVSRTLQMFILNFEAIRKFRNRHEIPEYLNPLSHSSYQSSTAIMCLLEQLHFCLLFSVFFLDFFPDYVTSIFFPQKD